MCLHANGKIFDFNTFRKLGDFIRSIYFGNISLEQAMNKLKEMEYLFRNLEPCRPKNLKENGIYKRNLKKLQKYFLKEET